MVLGLVDLALGFWVSGFGFVVVLFLCDVAGTQVLDLVCWLCGSLDCLSFGWFG